VYPAVRMHKYDGKAGAYYTLMMSTGLTFGTISALFGLNHQIITSGAVLLHCGHSHRQRRHSDHDCELVLSSPASSSPRTEKQESRAGSSCGQYPQKKVR
jgi:hypothetical protein